MLSTAQPFVGQEPAVPVTYLKSLSDGYGASETVTPKYDEQIVGLLEAYVERFAPGTLIQVDSPHFMEAATPDQIVEAPRHVIEAAGY